MYHSWVSFKNIIDPENKLKRNPQALVSYAYHVNVFNTFFYIIFLV